MFRNRKTVKHIEVKTSYWVAFYDYSKCLKSRSPFNYKPTKEIHENQVSEYDFNPSPHGRGEGGGGELLPSFRLFYL